MTEARPQGEDAHHAYDYMLSHPEIVSIDQVRATYFPLHWVYDGREVPEGLKPMYRIDASTPEEYAAVKELAPPYVNLRLTLQGEDIEAQAS